MKTGITILLNCKYAWGGYLSLEISFILNHCASAIYWTAADH